MKNLSIACIMEYYLGSILERTGFQDEKGIGTVFQFFEVLKENIKYIYFFIYFLNEYL